MAASRPRALDGLLPVTSLGPCAAAGRSRRYAGALACGGAPLENVATGGATGDPPSPINVYPTIGIRSTLKTGTYTILRTEDSQGSQLLQCDPAVSQGQEFTNFLNGCNPWYAKNSFTDPNWWNSTTQQCPNPGLWFGSGTMPAPYGANSAANPWRAKMAAAASASSGAQVAQRHVPMITW